MRTTNEILGKAASDYYVDNGGEWGSVLHVCHAAARDAAVAETRAIFAGDTDADGNRVGDNPEWIRGFDASYLAMELGDWVDAQLLTDADYDDEAEKRAEIIDILTPLRGWDDRYDAWLDRFSAQ